MSLETQSESLEKTFNHRERGEQTGESSVSSGFFPKKPLCVLLLTLGSLWFSFSMGFSTALLAHIMKGAAMPLPVKSITVEELKKKMDEKEDFQLIDVREKNEKDFADIGGELIPVATAAELWINEKGESKSRLCPNLPVI